MYFMYVDESGDPGLVGSPTRYFTLTGMVVHELRWHETLNKLVSFSWIANGRRDPCGRDAFSAWALD
jgi:hypothetical protein